MTFPAHQPPTPSNAVPPSTWTANDGPAISEHFLRLKKPADVSKDTLSLLNVTFQPECDFETLMSSLSNDAQSHLPPRDWLRPPEHIDLLMSSGSAVPLLSNGRRKPDHNEFFVRARELLFKNEDAFSTLTRKGSRGQVPLRLAHFRKFWEGLDNMAYYWDNSLDEYRSPTPEAVPGGQGPPQESAAGDLGELELGSPNEEEPRKKAKVEVTDSVEVALPSKQDDSSESRAVSQALPSNSTRVLPARSAPPRVPWATNLESQKKVEDFSQGYYRGYRIGNGAEMPDQYRIDCVRSFLEPIAWAFGVALSQHRRPPMLKLNTVRFPVRMSSVAWRGPQDRTKARQGWLEGPVLGMQCRADVNFGSSGNLAAESVLDTVRELGGLLLLAQERAREGQTEQRPGEGKWWTTTPRWGGGPGGEVGDAQGASDVPIKEAGVARDEKVNQRNADGSKSRRKPTPAEVWRTLRPGFSSWDPKTVYESIGKDKGAAWDDVSCHLCCDWHVDVLT